MTVMSCNALCLSTGFDPLTLMRPLQNVILSPNVVLSSNVVLSANVILSEAKNLKRRI